MNSRSWHERPDYTAPDDLRCEALVRGHPSWHREYTRHDHQCHKAAVQMRGSKDGRALGVCAVHARVREVTRWPD